MALDCIKIDHWIEDTKAITTALRNTKGRLSQPYMMMQRTGKYLPRQKYCVVDRRVDGSRSCKCCVMLGCAGKIPFYGGYPGAAPLHQDCLVYTDEKDAWSACEVRSQLLKDCPRLGQASTHAIVTWCVRLHIGCICS